MDGRRASFGLLSTLLVLVALASIPWNAATLHVTTGGSDNSGDGSAAKPYRTINHAYQEAEPFDTVLVHPGQYRECVNISTWDQGNYNGEKYIDVVAADFLDHGDNSTTILRWDGTINWSVVLVSSHSRLTGFTIMGTQNAPGVTIAGNGTVTHNVIRGNQSRRGAGILASAASGDVPSGGPVTIAHNEIFDNRAVVGGAVGVGGGIWAIVRGIDASLTIDSNVIRGNIADGDHAAGLYVSAGGSRGAEVAVVVTNNVITDNHFPTDQTRSVGGVYAYVGGLDSVHFDFSNNSITDNSARGGVGGMHAVVVHRSDTAEHELVIRDNTVSGNSGTESSGGVLIEALNRRTGTGGEMTIDFSNNTVTDNEATFGTGGVALALDVEASVQPPGAISLEGNRITGNLSEVEAGGVSITIVADSDPGPFSTPPFPSIASIDFIGNLVADNHNMQTRGPGIWVRHQSDGETTTETRLSLNTIVGNTAPYGSGGVAIDLETGFDGPGVHEGFASVQIDNSIVAENSGFGIGGLQPASPSYEINVDHTDVFGHPAGNYESWVGHRTGMEGNISLDPEFVDAGSGDFRLRATSPALDAGDPLIQSPPAADLAGAQRIIDGNGDGMAVVDMGAYERPDNMGPMASIVPVGPVECTSPAGALVALDGSTSTDPDSTPGTNDGIEIFDWFEDFGLPTETSLGEGEVIDVVFPVGAHMVTLQVSDVFDATDSATTGIAVMDTTAPDASATLVPAGMPLDNSRRLFSRYTVAIGATDTCDTDPVVEAVVDYGCGELDVQSGTLIEFSYNPGGCAAEQLDNGSLRVKGNGITLRLTATDASGNTIVAETSVPDLSGGRDVTLRP